MAGNTAFSIVCFVNVKTYSQYGTLWVIGDQVQDQQVSLRCGDTDGTMTINLYGPNHSFAMARNETHMNLHYYAGGTTADHLNVPLECNTTPVATGTGDLIQTTPRNPVFHGPGGEFLSRLEGWRIRTE